MFKISIVETRSRRRLILEGQLLPPWIGELKSAWRRAGEELQGRTLVIDLRNVTLISRDAENALFELMKDGAKFSSGDVLTKHVLQRLARRCKGGGNGDSEMSAKPVTHRENSDAVDSQDFKHR